MSINLTFGEWLKPTPCSDMIEAFVSEIVSDSIIRRLQL